MKTRIKLYRVVLNILFYIFYVLLASIAFSFIFPSILVVLGKDVWIPTDPRFINIQIGILILVLVFSLIFRKFFYLPINDKSSIKKNEIKNKKSYTESIKKKKIEKKKINLEKQDDGQELDIKIGKEIK